jgi:glutathionylspermidine synthase
MKVFNHPYRNIFFRKMGLKWYNVAPIDEVTGLPITNEQQPYGMYYCKNVSSTVVQEMKQASEAAGRVIKKTWEIVKGLDQSSLLELGFPPESLKVIRNENQLPFTMRLDWCWNEATKEKKIIEINCQTPSFLFECLEGNEYAANHFGLGNPNPEAHNVVKASLSYQLEEAAKKLGKRVEDCTIAFTALNNVEDMGTMQWLARQTRNLGFNSLLFPLEFLGVKGKELYFTRNSKKIDILFMWYPLEWAIYDTDEQGNRLWFDLEQAIAEQRAVAINFASGFVLQPKSIFSLITALGCDFFGEDAITVWDYFPKTSAIASEMGHSYFAKPILGRQGEGGYAVYKGNTLVESSGHAEWYTNQIYVYQQLLDLPTIPIEEYEFTALWGSWLFNINNEFVPAGVGMRVSDGPITDDYSYWCPIGYCC